MKDATWKKEEGMYKSKFTENGKKVTVHMDKSGNEMEKGYYIEQSELPQLAQDYLKKNCTGAKFEEVSKSG
ncbi:hypothetical protein QTN47_20925 [Danxiaibacter flavus]|uniref:Uncharacterized protein n=1 Tax=Danxiaibacter flavus TaxID=3049108 RepID=A0ABV3ZKG0_9BACT|nr:hypothetical protein QNM32_20930 [Chitinophagaceae bacterium DXS]